MAQAVVDILKPTIKDAVEQAMQQSITKLQTDIQAHDKHIDEAEQRIHTLEEELMEVQTATNKTDTTIQKLLENQYELENWSIRNNLRIVGVPESVKPIELQKLW